MSSKKICERALNFFQIYNDKGDVRLCSWTRDGHIGNLKENSIPEIYNSEAAKRVKDRHMAGDYSLCDVDACPYLAMNMIDAHCVTVDELPELPNSLYLGFERVCNYACTSCGTRSVMDKNKGNQTEIEKNYKIIKERVREVLPNIKHISANGTGELFASRNTLEILSEWCPKAPNKECSVSLETNGSLFDEEHWKQIENLGKYRLKVAISIMSFDEGVYQYLSGTSLPVSRIIDNLHFVSELRRSGIIDYLEIATVVQEQNFRTMPDFVSRCINDYEVDYIRLRPYEWWGECTIDEAWFKDVRNPRHPLYHEYKKVMSDSVMNHKKVHDWSGGKNTQVFSTFPSEMPQLKLDVITDISLNPDILLGRVETVRTEDPIIYIYAVSNVGKIINRILKDNGYNTKFIDRNTYIENFDDTEVLRFDDMRRIGTEAPIIVANIGNASEIMEMLTDRGMKNVITLKELVRDGGLKDRLDAAK